MSPQSLLRSIRQALPLYVRTHVSKFPDTDLRKKNFKVLSQGIYEGLFLFGPQQIYNSDQLQYGAEEWGNYPLIFIDQVARYSDHLSDTEKKELTINNYLPIRRGSYKIKDSPPSHPISRPARRIQVSVS